MGNIGSTIGSALGGAAGSALGSLIPGAGTAVGGALGTALGSSIGSSLGSKAGEALVDQADKALANSDWDDAAILRSIITEEDPSAATEEFLKWPVKDLKKYISDVHGYSPEEQDDIIKRVRTSTDIDNDGNIDVITTDSNGDGDADEAEVKPGKGSRKADKYAKEALTEENDSPLDNIDSTGTVTDDDDNDAAGIIKDTILSYKY